MNDVIDIVLGGRDSSNVIAQPSSPRVPCVGEFFSRKGVEYRVTRVEWIERREAHNTSRLGAVVYVEAV